MRRTDLIINFFQNADKMYRVLKCGKEKPNVISYYSRQHQEKMSLKNKIKIYFYNFEKNHIFGFWKKDLIFSSS